MIMKQTLLKRTQGSIKAFTNDIAAFKVMFYDIIKLWLPHPWDGNGEIYQKEEYKAKII